MDEEKQLMKYLSWLDELDQECIFNDADNELAVGISQIIMDHHDLTGQPSANSALQYDGNMANFDYSTKMIPDYNVNETMITETINAPQPSVIPDAYSYNFLSNDNYYSNPSIPQQHIPMNPAPYCMNSTGGDDSYVNTSEPQLCIDITTDSATLNAHQESSQYGLSNDGDVKDNFFTEEKHIMNDAYTNEQLSVDNANTSFTNEFSRIQHKPDMYRNEIVQETMQTDDITAHHNTFINNVTNSENNVQNSMITEPAITLNDDFKDRLKTECASEVKEEENTHRAEPDIVQREQLVAAPTNHVQQISHTEVIKHESQAKEEEYEPETKPNVNGVDKVSQENEISSIQVCIRNGCANRAVNNPEWEQEFCSNDCVIVHCRNVFTAWVQANEINNQ